MKIESITQTCIATPSQWEGKLTDGRMFYVRYRWGCLSISVSPAPTDQIVDAVRSDPIVHVCIGDDLDGYILWERVIPYLKNAGIELAE